MNDQRWLIVGLGNPGPTYANNRHNLGYQVVEELARRCGGAWRPDKFRRADVVEARLDGPGGVPLVLARPRSYMNEVGGPVAALLRYFRLPTGQLVAVHDELDLPFGALRVKYGGGDAGHNGLRLLRSVLETGGFHRIRVGIGRPPGQQDPRDYVLSDFSGGERRELPFVLDRAADAVESLISIGLARTQSAFNQ